ncbi:hypothetical protein GYMLUDRAFT_48469 [Collybiopsis luxurians FD-317 M1]|uniref:DUF6533 domain-containing protein n=1 Tax=Collybiopsis luxurians FD-317 M1 TaxID=944289 RepID=A0A0D0BJ27_9AGAR|nr:hypothetical protein GYMLUDRAFT_48469 [Collybiopsis luxurians FD-317 M1]
MNLTIAQQVSVAEQERIVSYCRLFSITFLFWDHLLTLPDEVQYLWKRPVRASTMLFFLNRYLAVLVNIVMTVSFFSSHLPESSCQPLNTFHQVLLVAMQVIVALLLTIRVYVLYRSSKLVLAVLLSIFTILMALSIFLTFSGQSKHSDETSMGCNTEMSFVTSAHVAAAWEALFLYDLILFAMTLHRAYQTRHELRIIRRLRVSLVVIILRDGSLYFAGMAIANAINISTFYYPLPYLRGSLTTFASSISVTMMSRLIFNLHKIANSGLYTSHITTVQLQAHDARILVVPPPDTPMP